MRTARAGVRAEIDTGRCFASAHDSAAGFADRLDRVPRERMDLCEAPTFGAQLAPVRLGRVEKIMSQTTEETNKALVLEAFDTLFNKRDFEAAKRFWAAEYIQHSAHIPPGRDGLFDLVRNAPPEMRYENGTVMAEGNLLMLHGRFSGIGAPANWIALDVVRLEDGLLKEHWDVIEDEATRGSSKSGLPMFGRTFPG
jgi:predicted SnoaL-like aldol condensation-catalyzing enzyme